MPSKLDNKDSLSDNSLSTLEVLDLSTDFGTQSFVKRATFYGDRVRGMVHAVSVGQKPDLGVTTVAIGADSKNFDQYLGEFINQFNLESSQIFRVPFDGRLPTYQLSEVKQQLLGAGKGMPVVVFEGMERIVEMSLDGRGMISFIEVRHSMDKSLSENRFILELNSAEIYPVLIFRLDSDLVSNEVYDKAVASFTRPDSHNNHAYIMPY